MGVLRRREDKRDLCRTAHPLPRVWQVAGAEGSEGYDPFLTSLGSNVHHLLVSAHPSLWRIGTKPQRDVGRLHRLPHHTHQVIIEGVQVRLVTQCGGEGFQGLPRVILPAVEAAVYKPLYAAS